MTGKLADTVMSVRNGEQIARKYQPVVYNPNTSAQVAVRARMKLMSQLSAVMAPVIAMRREGNVSARNMFVKTNFGASAYGSNKAEITLANVKLTRSVVGFPEIQAVRNGASLSVSITGTQAVDVSRVVYAMFVKGADNTLRFAQSDVITEAGGNYNWPATLNMPDENANVVVYAYGVRDNTDAARTIFGNMTTIPAETVASLIATRTLTETDITLTETKAVESAPSSPDANTRVEKKTK